MLCYSTALSNALNAPSNLRLSDNSTPTPTPTKKIIHWQTFSNSSRISNVVANHTYIDTLPFDGVIVSFPDYQECLGPNYIASYTTLYNL